MEKIEFKNLLTSLGFDVKLRGYIFFEELVTEVCELLKEGKEDNEIEKFIPVLVTEYGSCYHEIGRNRYLKSIDEFFAKRKNIQTEEKIDKELSAIITKMNLSSKILAFSKYINEVEIIEEDMPKVNVKNKK